MRLWMQIKQTLYLGAQATYLQSLILAYLRQEKEVWREKEDFKSRCDVSPFVPQSYECTVRFKDMCFEYSGEERGAELWTELPGGDLVQMAVEDASQMW